VIQIRENLIGQAAFEHKTVLINNIPPNYTIISSAIGQSSPSCLVISPFVFNNEIRGVLEIGALTLISDESVALLGSVSENIGMAIQSVKEHMQTLALLEETQQQSEKLKQNQRKLRIAYEESERKSKHQAFQKNEIERQNRELEEVSMELEKQANRLTLSSHYKSEFLSNVSHELKTPQNSMLILSQSLIKNQESTLTKTQMKSAQIIHNTGRELLNLIENILEFSKLTAGKTISQHFDKVCLSSFIQEIKSQWLSIARNQHLSFERSLEEGLPEFFLYRS